MRGVSACKAFTSLPVRASPVPKGNPAQGKGRVLQQGTAGIDAPATVLARGPWLATILIIGCWLVPVHSRTARGGSYARQPHDQDHLLQIVRLGPAGRPDGARAVDHTCRGARLRDAHPDRTGGVFEVRIDDEVICSRKERGRFPEIKKIKQLMRRPRSRARVYGQP
jgi:selT/selW/selH-like putative selenoprotein